MAEKSTTVGDLYKAQIITDGDLRSAIDAFMNDPAMASYVFPNGYQVDVAKAVSANEWTRAQFRLPEASLGMKRVAMRTAILLAQLGKT